MSGTPAAEVMVDAPLVQDLLEEQHPDLAAHTIELLDVGWDNFMFRLGKTMTVRLPRREMAASLIANEQDWLPSLARSLPIPISAPLRTGNPSEAYPWKWSVLPWFNGAPANENPPMNGEAVRLAYFLRALHQDAPTSAPVNVHRGKALSEKSDAVSVRLSNVQSMTAGFDSVLKAVWFRSLNAKSSSNICWLHGDLHARNILVDSGKISAIIDWGDITSGDVATDLASIWALFEDADARAMALESYGADADEIARAKGWAIVFGSILLDTGLVDNPRHAKMGIDTLRRVAEDTK